jgi:hypothetical protein
MIRQQHRRPAHWAIGAISGLLAVSLATPALGASTPTAPARRVFTGSDSLFSGAATSASDAWAVGYYFVGTSEQVPLIEHWSRGKWHITPNPRGGWQVGRCPHGRQRTVHQERLGSRRGARQAADRALERVRLAGGSGRDDRRLEGQRRACPRCRGLADIGMGGGPARLDRRRYSADRALEREEVERGA